VTLFAVSGLCRRLGKCGGAGTPGNDSTTSMQSKKGIGILGFHPPCCLCPVSGRPPRASVQRVRNPPCACPVSEKGFSLFARHKASMLWLVCPVKAPFRVAPEPARCHVAHMWHSPFFISAL